MAINFTNTGYINFNKKYNKKLKSGAITFSMSVSEKQEDGNFTYGYINCIIPKKYINDEFKKALKEDKTLVDVSGFITMNGKYPNAIIMDVCESKISKNDENEDNEDNEDNELEDDLPF